MLTESKKYTYQLHWSEEDREFVGTCVEFPYLSHLDESPQAAAAGIQQLVADCVRDMQQEGQPIPAPVNKRLTDDSATQGLSLWVAYDAVSLMADKVDSDGFTKHASQ